MKPAPFRYLAVESAAEAAAVLGQYGYEAKLLAGGQSLVPLLNFRLARPAVLVDISRIQDCREIQIEGESLILGGLTRQREVELSALVREQCPLLSEAAPYIGHVAIRNRGTVGGSLAHADPAAELPALAVALEAEFVLQSQSGTRTVPAAEFFVSVLTTALQPGELLSQVRIPLSSTRSGHAFLEVARRHGDFALVGVVCLLTPAADRPEQIGSARLVLMGVGDVPVRVGAAETVLTGQIASREAFQEAAAAVLDEIEPAADLQASATYRRHLSGVLTYQALERAWERVGKEPIQ